MATAYWALARTRDGWRLELGDEALPAEWTIFGRDLFGSGAREEGVEFLAYHDAAAAQHRIAAFKDGRLLGALFVAAEPVAVSRSWAADQLGMNFTSPAARLRLMAGRAGADMPDRGALV